MENNNNTNNDSNENDDNSPPLFNFGAPTSGGGAAPNNNNPFSFLFPSLFPGAAAPAGPPTGAPAARGGGRGRGGARGGRGGGGRGGGAPPPFVLDPSVIPPNSPLSFLFGGNPPPNFGVGDSDDDSDDDDSPVSYAAIKEERRRNKGKVPEMDRAYVLSQFAMGQPLSLAVHDTKSVLELKKELSADINFRRMPIESMGLYFRGKRMADEKSVVSYLFNDTKKMISCPANVILRLELHESMDHEDGLTFNNLPPEVLMLVLKFLDVKSIVQLHFVNKKLRALASSDILWKPLYGLLWSLQDWIRLVDQEDPADDKDKDKEREKASEQEKEREKEAEKAGEEDLCFSCYGLISDQKAGKKIEKIYLKDRLTWKERFKLREDMLKEQSMEEVQRRNVVKDLMKPLVLDEAKGNFKPYNVSVIKSCATASISFGAPAFNRGDEMACFRFYYNTQRQLVHQFKAIDPTLKSYSETTLKGLSYLEEALQMCKMDKKRWSHRKMNAEFREEEESPSRHAWRLRFAFDRATNLWKIIETNFSALRSIASEYFRRFQIEEAASALEEAQELLNEICYEVPTGASMDTRSESFVDRYLIYFDIANLRFALGEFDEAIRSLKIGYSYLPNNTSEFSFDLSVFRRRAEGGCWDVITSWFKELEKRIGQERNEQRKKDLALLRDWIEPTLKLTPPPLKTSSAN